MPVSGREKDHGSTAQNHSFKSGVKMILIQLRGTANRKINTLEN